MYIICRKFKKCKRVFLQNAVLEVFSCYPGLDDQIRTFCLFFNPTILRFTKFVGLIFRDFPKSNGQNVTKHTLFERILNKIKWEFTIEKYNSADSSFSFKPVVGKRIRSQVFYTSFRTRFMYVLFMRFSNCHCNFKTLRPQTW